MNMLKQLIIGTLIAVSMTACVNKVPEPSPLVDPSKEDPVADFDYSIDQKSGTVSFVNKSTGAIAYRWDFGDSGNSASVEENPTFVYKESGNFTVTLRASNGYVTNVTSRDIEYSLPDDVLIIDIDGNVSDWNKVPWRNDVPVWGALKRIKTATTKDRLYLLLECSKDVSGGHCDLSFDLDNNPETGNAEQDYIVKGGKGTDLFLEDGGFYVYRSDGTHDYDWIEGRWPEESGYFEMDGLLYQEMKFNMDTGWAYIDSPSDIFKMSIWFRDSSWKDIGATTPSDKWKPFTIELGQYREISEL